MPGDCAVKLHRWRKFTALIQALAYLACISATAEVSADQRKAPEHEGAPRELASWEAQSHLLETPPPIRLAGAEQRFAQVTVQLVVDPTGIVRSATPTYGDPKLYDRAAETAKTLRYKPFQVEGRAVAATFEASIQVLPLERLPRKRVPFPAVDDRTAVHIRLARDTSYSIDIDGTGAVTFVGGLVPGVHHDQIAAEDVDRLIALYREANFLALDDKYASRATDGLPVTISISIGETRKEVLDYFGPQVGMPQAVTELENAVDQAAGRDKWLVGGRGLVGSLKRENFDFKSWAAVYALYVATRGGAPETVREFIVEGTPVDDPRLPLKLLAVAENRQDPEIIAIITEAGAASDPAQLSTALLAAARRGNVVDIKNLIAKGANANFSDGDQTVLMAAARSGNPEAVAEILNHNPDVKAVTGGKTDRRKEAVIHFAVQAQFNDRASSVSVAKIVELLADAGADLDAQDMFGETALHHAAYGPIAEALVSKGASLNLRDRHGDTPMMRCQSSEVVTILLRHGADISIRDDQGRSILDIAKANKWDRIVEEIEKRSPRG